MSVCLSISLSICLSIRTFISQFVSVSVYQCVVVYKSLSLYKYIYVCVYIYHCLERACMCLSVYPSIFSVVCLRSVCGLQAVLHRPSAGASHVRWLHSLLSAAKRSQTVPNHPRPRQTSTERTTAPTFVPASVLTRRTPSAGVRAPRSAGYGRLTRTRCPAGGRAVFKLNRHEGTALCGSS